MSRPRKGKNKVRPNGCGTPSFVDAGPRTTKPVLHTLGNLLHHTPLLVVQFWGAKLTREKPSSKTTICRFWQCDGPLAFKRVEPT